MSRTPAPFTQAYLARVIRAAKQCGAGVEIQADGRTIRIATSTESCPVTEPPRIEPERKVVL